MTPGAPSARRWSRRDIQFCETIASQAALAIRNAQMYEDLRSCVDRDPLTGLLNHRAFYQRLGQELSYRTGGVVLTLGIEGGALVRYALLDRGSVADEYASLPEYHGPLPPGDVIALGANPTVVHRLTINQVLKIPYASEPVMVTVRRK